MLRFDQRCSVRKWILGQDYLVYSLQRKRFKTKGKSSLRVKGYSGGNPSRPIRIRKRKAEQVVDIILEVGEDIVLKQKVQHRQYKNTVGPTSEGPRSINDSEAICACCRKGNIFLHVLWKKNFPHTGSSEITSCVVYII
jgi:hypothetical protein